MLLKNNYNKILSLSIVTLMIFNLSCKNNEDDDVDPSKLPSTLSGHVGLSNEFGYGVSDNSGVTVKIKVGNDTLSTTTNSSGDFSFPNIKHGQYNLVYSKSGYKTAKQFNATHPLYIKPMLMPQPSTTIALGISYGTYTTTFGTLYAVSGSVYPNPTPINNRHIRAFYSRDSLVPPSNYVHSINPFILTSAGNYTFNIYVSELLDLGFAMGDTAYVAVYGDVPNSSYFYPNEFGEIDYLGLNAHRSNVLKLKVE